MTAIAISAFDGIYPVVNNRLLKESAAQTAQNVKITGGAVKPYKGTTTVVAKRSTGSPVTIYRFGQSEATDTQYWFEFTADADVVRGPVTGDLVERTYYTVSGQEPRMTTSALVGGAGVYPNGYYRLGVPPPTSAMTLAAGAGGTGTAETRYYVYTFVTALGEEGPPSAVASITVLPGQTVNITAMSTSPGGAYNINRKRIYRTVTGSQATDFQYVGEVAAATTSFTDNIGSAQLGELLATDGFYPPRSTVHNEPGGNAFNPVVVDASPFTLQGLTMMANGVMAGFAGNIVCFSEPFQPHAWKRENELTTDYPVVATKGFGGQSLAVLTTAYPYVVVGTDPSSMSMIKLDQLQACVSKRSVVAIGGGVVYASPDGLVQITQNGVEVITKGLFTKEEWQVYKPTSMHAYVYDGRYFCFYNTGTATGCLVFSFNGQEPMLVTLDLSATAGFMEPLTDTLYLMIGSNIVKFDAGSALTYTWKSKLFTLPKPMNLACAQVIAKTYPVTFNITGYDSAYSRTVSVTNNNAFRLPGNTKYNSIELTVTGTAEVAQISVASTMDELKAQ